MTERSPESILVFRPGSLGDTVVTLPAIWAIRARHPAARLTLLTNADPGQGTVSPWDVLGPTGLFAAVVFYASPARFLAGLRELVRVALRLRRARPTRLYYLAPTPRTRRQVARDRLFFRVCCGIAAARGLEATADWVGRRDAGGPVRLPPEAVRLARIVGEEPAPSRHPVPIGAAETAAVDELWRAAGIPPASVVIALGPGAKEAANRWPLERYQTLALGLHAALPEARVAIVGGPDEADFGRALSRQLPGRVANWAGLTTVWGSAEVLRRCALFVGPSSGPMHLAALMGTRCVAICSARAHPGHWEPVGDGHVVLRRNVPCAGCLLSECTEHGLECLTGITVDEVLAACLSVLRVSRRAAGR